MEIYIDIDFSLLCVRWARNWVLRHGILYRIFCSRYRINQSENCWNRNSGMVRRDNQISFDASLAQILLKIAFGYKNWQWNLADFKLFRNFAELVCNNEWRVKFIYGNLNQHLTQRTWTWQLDRINYLFRFDLYAERASTILKYFLCIV